MRPARVIVAALALGLAACSGAGGRVDAPHAELAPPRAISDAEFAAQLHRVLLDTSATDERQSVALGVVRAELGHAADRFDRGADSRGVASVLGALYLLREGELDPAVLDARANHAIDETIETLSRRGDDGRARVLLVLRQATTTGRARDEITAHIAALDRWTLESRTGKPIEQAGDAERAAIGKAMFDPTGIDDAITTISRWIDLAIEHNIAYRETGKRPTPEEATEVARALDSGATTVAALLLRYGDAHRAAAKIDASSARRIADPDFYAVLARAADKDDAPSWRTLFAALAAQTEGHIGGEIGIDKDLIDAAAFRVALEAYRRDPTHLATAVELSRSLATFGLSEAVPLVLQGALKEEARPEEIAATLGVLAEAVDADADAGDLAGAKRTIDASAEVIAVAARAGAGGKVAAAEVEYRMASVLVRGGSLSEARTLLVAATDVLPRASGFYVLALIERNAKEGDRALAHLDAVTRLEGIDPLDSADAKLLAFEIQRGEGKATEAASSLAGALADVSRALAGKQLGPDRVRGLRALGRVLAAYGDRDGSTKAYARAMDSAAGGDRALVGATMLDALSAALVRKDVGAARAALRKGRDAGVQQEDLVYGALWLSFIEREVGAKPDGSASEILGDAAGRPSWVGKLAMWATGHMTDEALAKEANNEATRVEAEFYVAMAKRTRGAGGEDSLRRVAESPVLDLIEVQIARDLTAPQISLVRPSGVKVP